MSELELEEPKWYVIHTFSSYEQMVLDNLNKCIKKNNLEDRILEVKIPMEEVIEEKNGKKKVVQRKMFPCYVLLKMRYTDNLWHTIVNTRGVTGFVGPQGRPIPLTDDEIRKMKLEKIRVDIKLEPGNKVKVVVMLRGREMQHSHLAMDLINKFQGEFEEGSVLIEKKPMIEGRNVVMILAPSGK